jgi:hypothetical protein
VTTVTGIIRGIVGARGPIATRPDPQFIAAYDFPPGMLDRALERCPESVTTEVLDVGLRQFFLAAAADPGLRASMPSRVVDEGWHEFITFTRAYEQFCQQAFGRFLHHQPEYLMDSHEATINQTSVLWGTWRTACGYAGLDPESTVHAPVLFSADVDAQVEGARRYVATCGSDGACTAAPGVTCVRHALRDHGHDGSSPPPPTRRPRHRHSSGASWVPFAGAGTSCGAHGCGSGGGCGSSCGSGCGSGGCGSS